MISGQLASWPAGVAVMAFGEALGKKVHLWDEKSKQLLLFSQVKAE